MTTPHNNTHTQGPVRVALIADARQAERLAPLIEACMLLQPLGRAGMPQTVMSLDVPWYDDVRVLLAQPELEGVLLADSPRANMEHGQLALEHGLHVWQLPPLGPNFAQACELVRRIRAERLVYRVASWWEHVVELAWQQLDWPDDFTVRYSELLCAKAGPPLDSWRARTHPSAGGALANAGYSFLEVLTALRGLPDSISAAIGRYRRGAGGSAGRETEDVAVATWRYDGGGLGMVRAVWDHFPAEEVLRLYSGEAALTLTETEAQLHDVHGASIDQQPLGTGFIARELQQFGEAVRGHARDRALAPLENHLAVSAVLETTYLSARTNHPETPAKFYQVQGWPLPRS